MGVGGGKRWEVDGYVCDLDGSDGFMVDMHPQTHQAMSMKYGQIFTYRSYLKWFKK